MIRHFESLFDMMEAFPDEQSCVDHLKGLLWKNGEYCPHCGHDTIYHFSDNRTHKCAECRQRFSIKVGTIFADTKLPLRKWFMAIWLITSHKKGIASTTLAKDIKITQKSAWFMLHRLRYAIRARSFGRPLKGVVEIDETAIGGKEKNKHANKKAHVRGMAGKAIVFGALERNGEFRAFEVHSLQGLKDVVRAHVKAGSFVVTDEFPGYAGLSKDYAHKTVNHSAGEYAHTGNFFHVNSIEGAWSHIKRQIYGIHHWISGKHLGRYLSEMTWRYNRRDIDEGNRMNEFLSHVHGRLKYKALIA